MKKMKQRFVSLFTMLLAITLLPVLMVNGEEAYEEETTTEADELEPVEIIDNKEISKFKILSFEPFNEEVLNEFTQEFVTVEEAQKLLPMELVGTIEQQEELQVIPVLEWHCTMLEDENKGIFEPEIDKTTYEWNEDVLLPSISFNLQMPPEVIEPAYLNAFIDWIEEDTYPDLYHNMHGNVFMTIEKDEASYEGMKQAMPKTIRAFDDTHGEWIDAKIVDWQWVGTDPDVHFKEYQLTNHVFRPVLAPEYKYNASDIPLLALHIVPSTKGGRLFAISNNTGNLQVIASEYDIPEKYRNFSFGIGTIKNTTYVSDTVRIYETTYQRSIENKQRTLYVKETVLSLDPGMTARYGNEDPRKAQPTAIGAQDNRSKGYAKIRYEFFYKDDNGNEKSIKLPGFTMICDIDKPSGYWDGTDIPDSIQAENFEKYYVFQGNYLGVDGNRIYGTDIFNEGADQFEPGTSDWKKMSVIVAFDTSSFTVTVGAGYARSTVLDSWEYNWKIDTKITGGSGEIDDSIFGIKSGNAHTIHYRPKEGNRLQSIKVDNQFVDIAQYPDAYTFSNITSNHAIEVAFEPCAKLTIKYLEKGTNKELAKQVGPTEYPVGMKYAVTSPMINKYHLVDSKQQSLSGTIPNKDIEFIVYYEKDPELTILYLNQLNQKEIAKAYGPTIQKEGTTYQVKSPTIEGYYLVDSKQATISGTMPNADKQIKVYYLPLYKITTEAVNGTITKAITGIKNGESKTIQYQPQEGHILEYIEVDGKKVNLNDYQKQYTFKNIEKDYHIKVVYFKPVAPKKAVKNEAGKDINEQYVAAKTKLTYEITVTNNASSELTYIVTDAIPLQTDYISASDNGVLKDGIVTWTLKLKAKETKVLTLNVQVKDGVKEMIQNEATQNVLQNTLKTNPVFNYTDYSPDEKKPLKTVLSEAKEEINKQYIANEETIQYVITVKNRSKSTKVFMVKDYVPEHTKLMNIEDGKMEENAIVWVREIEAGKTSEFKFSVKAIEDGVTIKNKALISVDEIVEEETNEVINYTPDLPIKQIANEQKEDLNLAMVFEGDEITYYIHVKNQAQEEKMIIIEDPLSKHLTFVQADHGGVYEKGIVRWILPLQANQEQTVTFKAKITEQAKGNVIENQATVLFDQIPIKTNRTKNPVMKDPVKTVTIDGIQVHGKQVDVGTKLTYTISFENLGEKEAEFTVFDTLPRNTKLIQIQDGGTYDTNTKEMTWKKKVAGKEKGEVSFVVETTRLASYIPNIATVKVNAKQLQTNLVENTTPDPIVIGDYVTVYKDANPKSGSQVQPGQEITYYLKVQNTGRDVAKKTTIKDTLASEISYIDNSCSDGGTYENGTLTWIIENLQPQASKTISFKVKVKDDIQNLYIRNYAVFQSSEDDAAMPKCTNEVVHRVGEPTIPMPVALEAMKKASTQGYVKENERITYTITIRNNGNRADDVVIVDTIPEWTTFIEANEGGQLNGQKNRVEWYLGTLEANAEKSVQFSVIVNAKGGLIKNQALFGDGITKEQLLDSQPKHKTNIVINPVEKKVDPKIMVPNTGDQNPIKRWITLGIGMILTIIFLVRLRKQVER